MNQTETAQSSPETAKPSRKKLKAEGRKKRSVKLKTDKEFAKKFHEGKSKRAIEKKAAFRKKKSKKR